MTNRLELWLCQANNRLSFSVVNRYRSMSITAVNPHTYPIEFTVDAETAREAITEVRWMLPLSIRNKATLVVQRTGNHTFTVHA